MLPLSKLLRFYKGDRDAIIVLTVVIVACVVLIPLLGDREDTLGSKTYDKSSQTTRKAKDKYFAQPGRNDGSVPAEGVCELFPFDPNTADSTQLLRLGLQPWQVRSIYKYRSKGGRFYKPTDFARLYGLTLKKYRQLEPYIRIKEEAMARDVIETSPNPSQGGELGLRTSKSPSLGGVRGGLEGLGPIDINTADTTLLKRIPGIGPYFARRIVELRQRKKAFVSPRELLTIRNFPEETLAYMTASQNFPEIHVNRLSLRELEHHPLLNYVQARDIINLRKSTGSLHSVKDLVSLPSFTPDLIEKIKPFLVFD